MFFAFFATFCISNGKFCIFHFGDPQIKKSKNRKFQNALKYDLNEFWYRFRVRRCPKTPKEPISTDITSFWMISANVWKIEFSSKLTFLMIFGLLSASHNLTDYMAGSVKKYVWRPEKASRDLQKYCTYRGWCFLMIRTNFEKWWKIIIFINFPSLSSKKENW